MGDITTMVSRASHPDQVAADESEADARNGTEARVLTSPTSSGNSRYTYLFLIAVIVTENVGISVIGERFGCFDCKNGAAPDPRGLATLIHHQPFVGRLRETPDGTKFASGVPVQQSGYP